MSRLAPARTWLTQARSWTRGKSPAWREAVFARWRTVASISAHAATRAREVVRRADWRVRVLAGVVSVECALLLIALAPPTVWARLGHPAGPIPAWLEPVVAGLFYLLPGLTGLLCRRWAAAVALATMPVWLDLGIFAVAAAPRVGPFYLAQEPHAAGSVGTIELFAVLGLLGWIARRALLDATGRWPATGDPRASASDRAAEA
jgi:hypothetical protein